MPSTGRPGYFVDIFVDMSMIITSRPVGEGQGWVPGLWCQLGAVQRPDGRVRVTKFNVIFSCYVHMWCPDMLHWETRSATSVRRFSSTCSVCRVRWGVSSSIVMVITSVPCQELNTEMFTRTENLRLGLIKFQVVASDWTRSCIIQNIQ